MSEKPEQSEDLRRSCGTCDHMKLSHVTAGCVVSRCTCRVFTEKQKPAPAQREAIQKTQ